MLRHKFYCRCRRKPRNGHQASAPFRSAMFIARDHHDFRSSVGAAHFAPPELEFRKERRSYKLSCLRHEKDRKSTRLNSSHTVISYAVFCLKKKKTNRSTCSPRRKYSRTHEPDPIQWW